MLKDIQIMLGQLKYANRVINDLTIRSMELIQEMEKLKGRKHEER